MDNSAPSGKTLSVLDAVTVIVGVVFGAGIFKTPSLVAANSGSEWTALSMWLVGGIVSLIGALCYAELSTAYPHAGGDYHYLNRAFGSTPSFMFVWARMTVIQTGSIAMWAFLIGDYASEVFSVGGYSPSLYACLTIIILTVINIAGIRPGVRMQKILLTSILAGLLLTVIAGFTLVSSSVPSKPASLPNASALGGAMIFVLLTYGGWNEAAFLSAEVRNPERNMVRVLFYSIGVITSIYLVINYVFLKGLGIAAVSGSEVVAADLMRRALGERGAQFISFLICIAALSSMNGVMITSARTNYALGRDFSFFRFLGQWDEKRSTPVNAVLLLGGVSLVLVLLGTGTRSGFVMMVEYTAPVFWFFFLLVGISLFVLRRTDPDTARPFRVPFYPFTPILFCAACAYMLRSSILYTGKGALIGIAVLIAGTPFLLLKARTMKLMQEREVQR